MKIGDRVRYVGSVHDEARGKIGTVTAYSPSGSFVWVHFPKDGTRYCAISRLKRVYNHLDPT